MFNTRLKLTPEEHKPNAIMRGILVGPKQDTPYIKLNAGGLFNSELQLRGDIFPRCEIIVEQIGADLYGCSGFVNPGRREGNAPNKI